MTKWSPYQEEIFAWANNPTQHLMVSAGAGCGKTSTIVQLYKILLEKNPTSKIVFMAFNKKIAQELSDRGVPGITMNAFGHRMVMKNFPKAKLETNKIRSLTRRYGFDYKKVNMVTRVVDLLKAYLHPQIGTKCEDVQNIIADFELSNDPINREMCENIINVFHDSINETNIFDFADQISFPIYHNLAVEKYDFVIIDECQDLSPNKLELVSRAVGNKFICVGDPLQAIYGFAGADSTSMTKIRTQFDPKVLSLPVTYRCGKRIVQEAHNKGVAPSNYQAGPDNPEGVVESISKDKFQANVQPKDFVLCRITAPLVTSCFGLIKKGVRAQILGRDVGKKLIDLVDKIEQVNQNPNVMQGWCAAYAEYRANEVGKLRKAEKETQADNLEDQLDCLFVFTDGCNTIPSMKAKIEQMFDDNINPDAVTFSTIHKSKGLEADRVFALSYKSKPPKQEKQIQEEKNLLYVQITRAKSYFAWVGLVLLMICSCVNAMTYELNDESLLPAVEQAVDMWSFATDLKFTRTYEDNPDIDIRLNNNLPVGIIGETYMYLTPKLVYVTTLHPSLTTPGMEHEFGHALGLLHNTNPDSIMQPNVPVSGFGCQQDIDNVRTVLDLSPKTIDIPMKIKKHRVLVFGPALVLNPLTNFYIYIKKHWVIKLPTGVFTFKMLTHNFQIEKIVTIK